MGKEAYTAAVELQVGRELVQVGSGRAVHFIRGVLVVSFCRTNGVGELGRDRPYLYDVKFAAENVTVLIVVRDCAWFHVSDDVLPRRTRGHASVPDDV